MGGFGGWWRFVGGLSLLTKWQVDTSQKCDGWEGHPARRIKLAAEPLADSPIKIFGTVHG